MRFQKNIRLIVLSGLAIVTGLMLTACATPDGVIGYDRGRTFHVELRAFFKTAETDAVYKIRSTVTESRRSRYPVSYGYPINTNAREGIPGFKFASCGLRAHVSIMGIKNPERLALSDLPLLTSGDVQIGTIRPSAYGDSWIRFDNMDIDSAKSIVLPYLFNKSAGTARIVVEPVNFNRIGPFMKDRGGVFEAMHRVYSNPRKGQEGRINVGMIIPIEVDSDDPQCVTR